MLKTVRLLSKTSEIWVLGHDLHRTLSLGGCMMVEYNFLLSHPLTEILLGKLLNQEITL